MKKLNITIPFDWIVFVGGIFLAVYGLLHSETYVYGTGTFCLGLSLGYGLKEELVRLKSSLSKSKARR